ncbi:MAG: (2Fe-2S)-binding protein [Sedimentisphaerales bacterium]|nr:(2Fe-2S)-binding protein [Sedimentisphaerales bacterium]
MPKVTIDNQQIEVPQGATILEAARKIGIDIPTLCYLPGLPANTSCMVCVVKVNGRERLLPACATLATDGMVVESETEEIHQARRTALELLLSDHVGDCAGPCQSLCPAGMNIPLMIRQIATGMFTEAIKTVKADIAMPAVLGRICPAPCEKGCRRSQQDDAVAICLLKRYVADVDLARTESYLPVQAADTDKRVAIVGAGPAGLAGAWHLLQNGIRCTIFDEHDKPGGALRSAIPVEQLPHEVLDAEIDLIRKLKADFQLNTRIGADISLDDLRKNYQAVLIATGSMKKEDVERLGLTWASKGIAAAKKTYQTSLTDVFAAGGVIAPSKMAVRSLAQAKAAAAAICQFLTGGKIVGEPAAFSVHMGKMRNGEIEQFMVHANDSPRQCQEIHQVEGFSDQQAVAEAGRCLHCDCRKPISCKLRTYSQLYQARANQFKEQRRLFEQQLQHREIIYEPGKCIDCGICIQVAAQAGEELGLSFVGRGFDVRVAVPFDKSIEQGLRKVGRQCVKACPTAALSFKEDGDEAAVR